jgi:hypothetical protein
MTQVVECLPTRAKALSSNPTITKKKKKVEKKPQISTEKREKLCFPCLMKYFSAKKSNGCQTVVAFHDCHDIMA